MVSLTAICSVFAKQRTKKVKRYKLSSPDVSLTAEKFYSTGTTSYRYLQTECKGTVTTWHYNLIICLERIEKTSLYSNFNFIIPRVFAISRFIFNDMPFHME